MRSPSVLSEAERELRLSEWSASSGVDLAPLDAGQRAVVVAALIFLGFVGGLATLCVHRTMWNTDSGASGTLIPEQVERPFRPCGTPIPGKWNAPGR